MTTQFNNTGVKTETGFAQVINDDAELKQASGGYITAMYGAAIATHALCALGMKFL